MTFIYVFALISNYLLHSHKLQVEKIIIQRKLHSDCSMTPKFNLVNKQKETEKLLNKGVMYEGRTIVIYIKYIDI